MNKKLISPLITSFVSLLVVCVVTYFTGRHYAILWSNKILIAGLFFVWITAILSYISSSFRMLRLFLGQTVDNKNVSRANDKFEFTLSDDSVIYGEYVSLPYENAFVLHNGIIDQMVLISDVKSIAVIHFDGRRADVDINKLIENVRKAK